jgi:ornithine--oxo-acid transaminase
MSDKIALERRHGATNYDPLPVVLTRGEGAWLWDDQDRRYLDMLSAYSAVSFGYGHPKLVAVLTEQARRLAVTSRAFHSDRLPPFLAKLCEVTGMDRALPMSTGAEGVETAIKCARKWAYRVKKVPANSAEIIVCEGNFHGRTTTIVGFSSEPQYRDDFGPYAPGAFRHVPFGDAHALEAAITPNTAAFLVEPVQGEAGIVVPPEGYLAQCERVCRANNVLLIVDEVQTGLGRTGKVLAIHHEGVKPDGVILGKALGGGLLPVSAFCAREDVMVFRPGDHGSTFGGNALAAAVGLASLELLLEAKLSERAATLGDYFLRRLKAISSPLVTEVRGKGLLIGIELDARQVTARKFVETLLRHGVLSKDTHGTVARFAPPLIVEREDLDWAIKRIVAALREYGPVYENAAQVGPRASQCPQ